MPAQSELHPPDGSLACETASCGGYSPALSSALADRSSRGPGWPDSAGMTAGEGSIRQKMWWLGWIPPGTRAGLMAEAIGHASTARRDELAAEMLEQACFPLTDRSSPRQLASAAAFQSAFVSVYGELTPHAQGAAKVVGEVDWSDAIGRYLDSNTAPVGGILAAVDLNCNESVLKLARDAVCPPGPLVSTPEATGQQITQVCAALAARLATSDAASDSHKLLSRIVYVLSNAATTVDQHKQDVVLEMIAEALARLKLGGGRVCTRLFGDVLAEAESPAAILIRTRLRKAKHARWDGAAVALLGVPSVALAAAERVLRFEPGSCDEIGTRRHVLLHPDRAAVIRRQLAMSKAKDAPLLRAIESGPAGERVAALLISTVSAAASPTAGPKPVAIEITGIDDAISRLAASKEASIRHAALRLAIEHKLAPLVLEACFDSSPTIAKSAVLASIFARGKRANATARVLEALEKSGSRDVRRLIEQSSLRPAAAQSYAWPDGDDAAISRKLVGLRGRPIDPSFADALADFVSGEAVKETSEMPRTAAAALPLLARSENPLATGAIDDALTAVDPRIRSAGFEAMAAKARRSSDEYQIREAKITLRAGLGDGHHRVRGSCIRAVVSLDPHGEQSRDAAARVICEMVESKFSLNQRAAMWAVSAVASEFAGDARVRAAVEHVRHNPADEAAIWRADRAGLGLGIFANLRHDDQTPARYSEVGQ